ncbi:MAG: hypothetical protein Q9N62_08525 [Ghiorsea sp.]|nr:hypothetical protein [Ghiorsea sp.]
MADFGIQEFRFPFSGDKGYKGLMELKKAAKQWWKHHHDAFDVVVSQQAFCDVGIAGGGVSVASVAVCATLWLVKSMKTRHALDMHVKHRVAIAAMRKLEAKVYRSAQQVMVLSQYTQHKLQRFFGLGARRFVVNAGAAEPYQGLDIVQRDALRVELGWDTPVVSTLRNLVPRTGVDLMIQVAAIVKNRHSWKYDLC